MEDLMKYTVTPGEIEVSEDGVTQVIDHDDVKIFEIDLVVSKYPGSITEWSSGSQKGVLISADERTLNLDETARPNEPTCFTMHFDGDDAWDWIVIGTGSRYTVRVVAYRVER